MFYTLSYSTKPLKKYMVQIDGKTIHFGDSRYSDFLMNQNRVKKELYLLRHQVRENWNDIYKPGFWSRWLLWNKPTLEESILDLEQKQGLFWKNSSRLD